MKTEKKSPYGDYQVIIAPSQGGDNGVGYHAYTLGGIRFHEEHENAAGYAPIIMRWLMGEIKDHPGYIPEGKALVVTAGSYDGENSVVMSEEIIGTGLEGTLRQAVSEIGAKDVVKNWHTWKAEFQVDQKL